MPVAVVAAPAACVKSVRWEATQAPYNVVLADGRRGGYYADVVVEALRRLGCEARLVDMPWGRGMHELETGRLDINTGLLRTPEREAFAHFTRGINFAPNRLYLSARARSRYPHLAQIGDLIGTDLHIGVETGARYGPAYNALLADPAFVERLSVTPDRQKAWEMLARDRLDGVISDDVMARVVGLPKQPPERGVQVVMTLSAEPARVALSRRSVSADFAQRFDAVLQAMIDDGTAVRLREQYVPCRTDPVTMGCTDTAPASVAP
jgi:polar amino acid transport system substrate-binding protein